MKTKKKDTCPLCGGTKTKGKTTFTVDLGFGVIVVRQVPATVCSLCGAEWLDNKAAEKVESIVEKARHEKINRQHNSILLYSDIPSYTSPSFHGIAKEPEAKYGKSKKDSEGTKTTAR